MEKIIEIGGKEVKLKSTAGIVVVYRNNFGDDFMKSLIKMQGVDNDNALEKIDFEFLQKAMWCMVKLADEEAPDYETWLNQFEFVDVIQASKDIIELLIGNLKQIDGKKKEVKEEPKVEK